MRICTLSLLLALCAGCCTKRVSPGIRQSNAAIRARLLVETPKGCSVEDVSSFVSNDLCHDGEVRNFIPFDKKTRVIRVGLGHYAEPGAWFLFQTYVDADWLFDDQERLEEISVTRGTIGF
jgi:hypothetical protein